MRAGLLGVVLFLGLCLGCNVSRPTLRNPGSVQQQRYGATLHDPYADNDLGPEVVGSRPREFQKPLAEPVRNRWMADSWWRGF